MEELDAYLNKVKQLPPAPRTLAKLLSLLGDPDVDTTEIVELITHEPALTATVLQRCNAAFFAAGQPVTTVAQALNRLGFNQIFRIVAVIVGSQSFSPVQKSYGFEHGDLWRHSVAAALAAQKIAERRGDDGNVAFTAGLLHDIGKTVLCEALEEHYTVLIQETEANQQSLLEVEKKVLHVDHAEIGGRLLERWNFPAELVMAVWHHHAPGEAGEHQKWAAYTYLGNMIAHFMSYSFGHQAFAFRGREEALNIVGIRAEDIPACMIATFEAIQPVEILFNMRK
jgi:putative nucleotidyltransferase with HDIG domain